MKHQPPSRVRLKQKLNKYKLWVYCIGCCVIKSITKIVHPSLPSTPSALLASESEISNSESIPAKLSVQSKCSNSLKCSNSKPDSAADDIVHMPRVSAMKVTKINSLTPNRSYRMLDSNKVLNSKKAKEQSKPKLPKVARQTMPWRRRRTMS
jgi:hypothetical protein